MNKMAVINIAKNELGMEDDDYRAFLKIMTGKDSLRKMTQKELGDVLDGLKRKGFRVKRKSSRNYSSKKYVRLIYALWKSCHQKGVINDGSRQALRTFVKDNFAKVDDPEFLSYAQATPVIEALKAMEKRA